MSVPDSIVVAAPNRTSAEIAAELDRTRERLSGDVEALRDLSLIHI